ncbi:RsmB/NOP family class I SAM-dependent RNA methyltransferase [Paenibacillus hexagrammi]|uniref:RsmB/NOP family class I SAM-dependent RNA methyltransferase n=1 Tax=Paenibacillus hexagrammi TaxID=2908839 RepID=A0ABY3SC38_9BACL|nr:RsmB/NOP family class I SAM-dependent RNA methyltransferase [Paenibacillus sp. YPD9-1]UJF31564.1 RsmB/NOP family class I SAM-dependent RNA methyltransferase [Paenibacillus sp. YPD9-1]
MVQLPASYIKQMNDMLGEETPLFLQSYEQPRTQGVRFNPLKADMSSPIIRELIRQFQLEPVPWCSTGFYYEEPLRPGKHPFHQAGLYYIQEPSAMSAVELLAPEPGDIVLDLAAAPGGKTSHIAGKMLGEGILIANEIHPGRAKILSENVERMGIRNAVVTNAAPDRLASKFPAFFDKIMLDAPCSGEGMFRKDHDAIAEWSPQHVTMCAARQMDILPDAVTMLKPGGQMAYSTCTFNKEENEATIDELLRRFPELEVVRTERIWPHKHKGEGHFVALLRKQHTHSDLDESEEASSRMPGKKSKITSNTPSKQQLQKAVKEAMTMFQSLCNEAMPAYQLPTGESLLFGEHLYVLPAAKERPLTIAQLEGLKVLRAGLHLGEVKKNRFEPSHALALAVSHEVLRSARTYDLSPDSAEAHAYLRGETLFTDRSTQGWAIVIVDGLALGWGKESEGQLKNHYPKGLRRF